MAKVVSGRFDHITIPYHCAQLTVITENRIQFITREDMQPHGLDLQFSLYNFTINGHIQFNFNK